MTRQIRKVAYILILLLLFVCIISVVNYIDNPALGIGNLLLIGFLAVVVMFFKGLVIGTVQKGVADFVKRYETEGKRPVNHDIEKAAREAFKNALAVFVRELPVQGHPSDLDSLRDTLWELKKDVSVPSPWRAWPEFPFLDKPETFRSLWSTEAQLFFSAELEQAARQWVEEFPKTPVWVRDAAQQKPGFSALWAECFRHQIKHNQPAATAHSFAFLSSFAQPVSTPSVSHSGRRSRKQRTADEILIRKIKDTLPVAPDMVGFLSGLETTLKRQQRALLLGVVAGIVCLCTLPLGYALFRHEAKSAERDNQNKHIAGKILDKVESIELSMKNKSLMGDVIYRMNYLKYDDGLQKITRTHQERYDHALRIEAQTRSLTVAEAQAILDSERIRAADALERSQVALLDKRLADADRESVLAVEEALAWKKAGDAQSVLKLSAVYMQRGFTLEALDRFSEAVTVYREAVEIIPKSDAPESWAVLNVLLGAATFELAGRSTGKDIQQRLNEALQAYRTALTVYTRESFPQGWAVAQNDMGVVLGDLAFVSDGEQRAGLLAEAVTAYREALTVYTQKDFLQSWASTQNNLGTVLSRQASACGGEQRMRLLAEAVTAYREALKVYTQEDFPQEWIRAQNNLGTALHEQALTSVGEQQAGLLAEAVELFRASLTVSTQKGVSQDWAMMQNNLGTALLRQAKTSDMGNRVDLLARAVEAYREALKVYTQEDFPQRWAATQNNLGSALYDQALISDGKQYAELLAESVEAYCKALMVYTQKDLPQAWAMTQGNLGQALSDQAFISDGEQRANMLAEVVKVFCASLEVYTQKDFPQEWVKVQNNLGVALHDQAEATKDKTEKKRLLNEAITFFERTLVVWTKEDFPKQHRMVQGNLGIVRRLLDELE